MIFDLDVPKNRDDLLDLVAKIGYEDNVEALITLPSDGLIYNATLDLSDFKKNQDAYTIIDVRNPNEVEENVFFENAMNRPLNELRHTAGTVPTEKPIVVNCGGGYRSAIGSSILDQKLSDTKVYDLGANIKDF